MDRFRIPDAAGAVFLLILCILSCGCGDYVPNHDIMVTRIQADGSAAWTRVIDSGYDDTAGDIAELADRDLVIAGGNASMRYGAPVPEVILLAPDGTVRSAIPCPELSGEMTSVVPARDGSFAAGTYEGDVGRFQSNGTLVGKTASGLSGMWEIALLPDGGIAAAGQSESMYPAGSVAVFDANGTVETRAPLPDESVETPGCRQTILGPGKQNIPVTECVAPVRSAMQAAIVLMDRNGSIVWQRGFGASGLESFWSIAAPETGGGFFLSAFGRSPETGNSGENHRFAVFLRPDGSTRWITDLGTASLYYPSGWITGPGSSRLIIPEEFAIGNDSTGIRPRILDLDAAGNITGSKGIDASRFIVPTRDGGFFSAGVPLGGGSTGYTDGSYGTNSDGIHAMKFDAAGTREWDRAVDADRNSGTVVRVLQTADGGYAILSLRQNPV